MNLVNIKYILTIEEYGSISTAAKQLFVAQPNLSRAVKEVESEYGIKIFERTAKGVIPTTEGRRFIEKIRSIQYGLDSLSDEFINGKNNEVAFRISVPRATYISDAFSQYLKSMNNTSSISINYCETNSMDTIQNVEQHDYDIGIIRYAKKYESYYKSLLKLRGLSYEKLIEFDYRVLLNSDNPLSQKDEVSRDELRDLIELIHGDTILPNGNYADIDADIEDEIKTKKRIYIYERGSQFEILKSVPNAYMWTSRIPDDILKNNGLVQKKCKGLEYSMRDYIIYSRKQRHECKDLLRFIKQNAERFQND